MHMHLSNLFPQRNTVCVMSEPGYCKSVYTFTLNDQTCIPEEDKTSFYNCSTVVLDTVFLVSMMLISLQEKDRRMVHIT